MCVLDLMGVLCPGSHVNLAQVESVKASHIVLEPHGDSLVVYIYSGFTHQDTCGHVSFAAQDVDGERYPNVATYISTLPGKLSLIS